jgi:hypothetical protein
VCSSDFSGNRGIGRVLSLEKNFYRLPFTPPPHLSGRLFGASEAQAQAHPTGDLPHRANRALVPLVV